MHKINYITYIIFIVLLGIIRAQYNDTPRQDKAGVIRGMVVDEITGEPKAYASISILKKRDNSKLKEIVNIDENESTQEVDKEDISDIIEERIDDFNIYTFDIVAGGVSDENGKFFIDQIPIGEYQVKVKYIGYEIHVIDAVAILPPDKFIIDVGTIEISPILLKMKEVSVIDVPIIEQVAKTIYPVEDTARESGGTAEEVLEQLPGLSVDMDGNITLRGNSNVTILIDGRRSNITIDMLNANMIEQVEVMTTPSAKYDPDGDAGIINIILIKNKLLGKSGKIGLNLAERDGRNLSATYNLFRNDFNLFTSMSYREKHHQGRGFRKTTYLHQPESTEIEGEELPYHSWLDTLDYVIVDQMISTHTSERYPNNANVKLGLEKYFNDKNIIAFDITYMNYDDTDSNYVSIYSNPIDAESSTNSTLSIYTGSGQNLNYGLGYYMDDKDLGSSLSMQFDYDDYNYDFNTANFNTEISDFGSDEGSTKIGTIDYLVPFGMVFPFLDNEYNKEAIIEIGIKAIEEIELNDFNIEEESFSINYEDKINSIYFNTSYYLNQSFGVQIGARHEMQNKNFILDIAPLSCEQEICTLFNDYIEYKNLIQIDNQGHVISENFDYEQNRIYPSLYFIYNKQELGNIKFGMSRRINRPWHRSTNPIPELEDFSTGFIDVGNPGLLPEDIVNAELSYSNRLPIGFFKATLYANNVKNKIDRDKDTYCPDIQEDFTCNPDVDPYQVLSWDNISETKGYGFDATLMTRPLPIWDLRLYGRFWYDETVTAVENDQYGEEYGFWGMLHSKFKLDKKQQISIYSHLSSPMTITTGEIAPFKRMDVSYKRKISDKFNFTLKLKDLFDTGGFKIMTAQEQDLSGEYLLDPTNSLETIIYESLFEYLDAEHKRGKRTVSINFEYKFGNFGEDKKYKRDESGRPNGQGNEEGGMDQSF